jgi:AcrR family transcriptional regulator
VVATAKERFWERGYEATGVADLELATGLNRSSLYNCFGSKEALFSLALGDYIDSFVNPLLTPMEGPAAGVRHVEEFFRRLRTMFHDDPRSARRGCLWINSIVEFSGRPAPVDVRSAEYRERLRSAFAHALRRETDARLVEQRARVLAATTFGIWVLARVDPGEAVLACAAASAQVRRWNRSH